jgi:hypothetical protein
MRSQKDRIERTFYASGQVETEITYDRGHVNGVTKRWHPNGVLASAIPVEDDMVEGVARFWDDSGKLLGEYEILGGTGIQKMWFPNGQLMGETPMQNGMITGRQIAFFENGEFCAETYYIANKKVSKKRYQEACRTDPSLPRYEDEVPKARRGIVPESSQAAGDEAETDMLSEELLADANSREVLEWLAEGSATRTLGELPTREASIGLARDIYDLGAIRVTAVRIDRYPDRQENTGKLVISLPREETAREKLLGWAGQIAEEQGYEPVQDSGQNYLFVMLD